LILFAALSLTISCAGTTQTTPPNPQISTYVLGPNKASKRALVFVHGIFGDSRTTWENKTGRSFFDLIKEDLRTKGENSVFFGSDLYTFGFGSRFIGSSFTIDQAVQNLRERLAGDGILDYEQIIFVAHSMGGLIAERFLLTYHRESQKVPLAVLYSTPHEGSELANVGQYVLKNPGLVTMIFGDHNQYLAGHRSMWRNAIDQGTIRTRIRCAYEIRKTGNVKVVEENSALQFCDGNPMPVDTDHVDIVKPVLPGERRDEDSFLLLKNALREIDKPKVPVLGAQIVPPTKAGHKQAGIEPPYHENAILSAVVLIDLLDSGSLNKDEKFVADKVHRNLAELLNNSGHLVNAPPLSVAVNSANSQISNRINIKTDLDGDNLTIHVALTTADGLFVASTELTGPLTELKKIYKVLPEAILFGLDVDEQTLSKKKTAKPPTKSVEAYANYLYARRAISSGDIKSAELALRKAIALDERFAMAIWSLGVMLTDQGKASAGDKFLEDADRIDPDHPKISFSSTSKRSHPVPALLSAIRTSEPRLVEAGLVFRKAISKEYGIAMRIWSVDTAGFEIDLTEQKDPHGSSIREFLADPGTTLALNGGFFEIDHSKRLSPSGVLVINGKVRNASLHDRLSGALVRNSKGISIIEAKDLGQLTNYDFALQTGPILVEGRGKLGIRRNDYDRVNRAAVCLRDHLILFVTVHGLDGNGLSLYEFAELLAAREIDGGLDCNLAINLDGGPSTQVGMNVAGTREHVDGLWKIHNAVVVRRK